MRSRIDGRPGSRDPVRSAFPAGVVAVTVAATQADGAARSEGPRGARTSPSLDDRGPEALNGSGGSGALMTWSMPWPDVHALALVWSGVRSAT